jgi:hypothetical protein
MKIDLVFLLVIFVFAIYYLCDTKNVEKMSNVSNDIKEGIRQVYLADVDAIRNLSDVAKKLQAGGITNPGNMNVNGKLNIGTAAPAKDLPDWLNLSVENGGDSHIRLKTKNDDNKNVYLINHDGHFKVHHHGVGNMFGVNHDGHHYVRHTGDHVMHVEGDGNNPYISLGKTGTWGGKKLYIQNVDAHSEVPTFRVGVHDKGSMMDMSQKYGARWARKDGRWTHFDWEDNKNYIRGDTQHDNNLNVGGNTVVNGNLVVNGGSITLNGPGGNSFKFELSADDSRAHNGGQRMVIKNKHGGRVLDIYQDEVKNWKEGAPEPVTIFSRGAGAHSYLNVRQHGFYTSTNACGHATWGHMGCNLRHALS